MSWRLTVEQILTLTGTEKVVGQFKGELTGIADLREATGTDLSFLSGGKYSKYLASSAAGIVLVPENQTGNPPDGQAWILCEDPSMALANLCDHLERALVPSRITGIHPTAIIDASAKLDSSVAVGPYSIIGEGVTIGKGTIVESSVRIDKNAVIGEACILSHGSVIGWGCRVGNRCRIFPGAVLGADGFGYHSDATRHTRLPQIGIVVIEDDVDIGANTCIDRARFAQTFIGEGTKIDNLVQIGHNCILGKHCIICAHVGMAGSTVLGNFVVLAGQVGLSGHIKVGDGVVGTGQTGITKDIPPGTVLSGTPARPHREVLKQQIQIKNLPNLYDRVKAIEDKLT